MKSIWLSLMVLISMTLACALASESPLPDLTSKPQQPDAHLIQSIPKSSPPLNTAAVDAKGKRHRGKDYLGRIPPWFADRVKTVPPEYPLADRVQRHEGHGLFRLTLDLQTGRVAKVTTLESTGFVTLDRWAIAALRQWRWKPTKWKEIDMGVTFTMSGDPLPRSAVPLPYSY